MPLHAPFITERKKILPREDSRNLQTLAENLLLKLSARLLHYPLPRNEQNLTQPPKAHYAIFLPLKIQTINKVLPTLN